MSDLVGAGLTVAVIAAGVIAAGLVLHYGGHLPVLADARSGLGA